MKLTKSESARQVRLQIRAAELVEISNSSRVNRFSEMTATEFDWFVHGDWPAHTVYQCVPETDEEAALLAHHIDNHLHDEAMRKMRENYNKGVSK